MGVRTFVLQRMFGNAWCLFFFVTNGLGNDAGIQWVEPMHADKHPIITGQFPQQCIIWFQMPIVMRLRNLTLEHSDLFWDTQDSKELWQIIYSQKFSLWLEKGWGGETVNEIWQGTNVLWELQNRNEGKNRFQALADPRSREIVITNHR